MVAGQMMDLEAENKKLSIGDELTFNDEKIGKIVFQSGTKLLANMAKRFGTLVQNIA